MKIRSEHGFGGLEVLLVIVIIGLVGGVGYYVLNQNHKKNIVSLSSSSNNPATTQTVKATGTTQSTDDITKQDASSEASIDSKYESNEQSNAKSANQAVSNVGGAYDESTF